MKIIWATIITLSLTACAGVQTQNKINSMAKAEFGAWERVQVLNKEQCPNSTNEKPLPSSMAIEKHECWASLVRENVAPVAMAPDLLMKFMTDSKQEALNYKKGTIDRDEVNLAYERLWGDYYAALDDRARNSLMYANQQDQAFVQSLQNASQQANQAELERQQAIKAKRPKNTNCNVWNNTMNCTSW